MYKSMKHFLFLFVLIVLFALFVFPCFADSVQFEFSDIDAFYYLDDGTKASLPDRRIDFNYFNIPSRSLGVSDDIPAVLCYLNVTPGHLPEVRGFDLDIKYQTTTFEILNGEFYTFDFYILTDYPLLDNGVAKDYSLSLNFSALVSEPVPDVVASTPVNVINVSSVGTVLDPFSSEYSYFVNRVRGQVLGVDIYNALMRKSPGVAFDTVQFDNITFEYYLEPDEYYNASTPAVGFSKFLTVSGVPREDASVEIQKEINSKLDQILSFQSGVDVNSSMNDFNDIDTEYGNLEDDLMDSVGDHFQNSVGDGQLDLNFLQMDYGNALSVIGALLGSLLNFQGLSIIIGILLTLKVVGVLFNYNLGSVGGINSGIERTQARRRKNEAWKDFKRRLFKDK